MSATRHYDKDDLALYAMQLLSANEAAEVALHIQDCAECRQELALVHGDLAIYAHTVDLHSPPALTRERLMKQVAKEKKAIPIKREPVREIQAVAAPIEPFRSSESSSSVYDFDEDEEPARSGLAKILPWTGWAVAAGLAVTAAMFYHQRESMRDAMTMQTAQMAHLTADAAAARQLMETLTDSTAMRVTLKRADEAPVPQGKTIYVPERGALVFIASNMEPLQPYKVYELWLIPADGRDPMPAGTFHPDARGNASVIMPELPKGVDAKAFGITIEDEGGSKTPTMPIIMSGA
jgi:anti-sigma-K factor RskA